MIDFINSIVNVTGGLLFALVTHILLNAILLAIVVLGISLVVIMVWDRWHQLKTIYRRDKHDYID